MKAFGFIMVYLHDIGMRNFSAFGRAIHPEFAAQEVFTEAFDEIIDQIWSDNIGDLAWRISSLLDSGDIGGDPKTIIRECLALSLTHSKSKVPIAVMNDPVRLRRALMESIGTPLHLGYLKYCLKKAERLHKETPGRDVTIAKARKALEEYLVSEGAQLETDAHVARHYQNFEADSFSWIVASGARAREFLLDITDALRCVRAADSLRQRGTTFKTSGGCEIFVDQHSANAIFALRTEDNSKMVLLQSQELISAGEANLGSSAITPDGNLRVTFNRGAFTQPGAVDLAVESVVFVIHDIQADAVQSFDRHGPLTEGMPRPPKAASEMRIIIEGVHDNHEFARKVCALIRAKHPEIAHRTETAPSLQGVREQERDLYMSGRPVHWERRERQRLLDDLVRFGHRSTTMNVDKAFKHTRLVSVRSGDVVLEAGTPPGFVFIPLDEGLRIAPLGGYQTVPAPSRVPLGNTGVIRGDVRNARVFAEKAVELLMIPKDVYLDEWHATYLVDDLGGVFTRLGLRHQ